MRIILFVAGTLLLWACAPRRAATPIQLNVTPRLESVVGRSALELVSQADRVEAFRLDQKPSRGRVIHEIADYITEIGGPVAVDSVSASELSSILTADRSYQWDLYKPCLPTPGVKLRFARERDHVDMYLCFQCRILMSGGSMDPAHWANVVMSQD